MRVVVAEKPSVARDLARVLGATTRRDGYIEGPGLRITWCFGHMVELEEPAHYDPAWKRWSLDTLPMLPSPFAVRARKGARDQLKVLRTLMRDRAVETVVNACDAGREGELIFRWVYEITGCRADVQRLWISSLTDDAIRRGWSELRPAARFDDLAHAARCRAEADWLVGLNATRALTCKARAVGADGVLSIGRVQTPTLAMIVARDREIEAFVPETFWQVKARMLPVDLPEPRTWEAIWTRSLPTEGADEKRAPSGDDEVAAPAERVPSREIAEAIARAARNQRGRVCRAQRKSTRERPPLLYDLTSLQRRANQRYGLSAQRTLEIAQVLYERHKLITYPRTDARYITEAEVATLPDVLRGLRPIPVYQPFVDALLARPLQPGRRVVDPSEVGDHHAILPTGRTPSGRLSPDEKRIFDLVARRLLAALSDDALFDVTDLVVEVPPGAPLPDEVPVPMLFRTRGRVCRQEGWRAVDPPGPSREVDLPPVEEGDPAVAEEATVHEGQTRPPRPYSDATLLRAMETAGRHLEDAELKRAMRNHGLGTPATRAAILQTLLDRQFVVRDGRALRSTERGRVVIDALPVDELKDAQLTGQWEGRLAHIADGRESRERFMSDVAEHTRAIVQAIAGAAAPRLEAARVDTAPLGDCPSCGQPVRDRGRVFACDGGRECRFVVFKTMSKRAVSARMVQQLLADGRSRPVKGFRSKKGKDFTAGLVWDAEAGRVGFWFPGDEARKPPPPSDTASPPARDARQAPDGGDPAGTVCPKCGQGRILRGRRAWGCERWREGCDWRRPFA